MNTATPAAPSPSFTRLSWLCASTPALVLAGLITLALHVRLGLGRWPMPVTENYITTAYSFHWKLVLACFYTAALGAMPAWSLMLLLQRGNISPRVCWTQLTCYVLGWMLLILAAILDPTPFTEWLLD